MLDPATSVLAAYKHAAQLPGTVYMGVAALMLPILAGCKRAADMLAGTRLGNHPISLPAYLLLIFAGLLPVAFLSMAAMGATVNWMDEDRGCTLVHFQGGQEQSRMFLDAPFCVVWRKNKVQGH